MKQKTYCGSRYGFGHGETEICGEAGMLGIYQCAACKESELNDRLAKAESALALIATPKRPDGTWNRDREACRVLAAETLEALK